MHPLEARIDGQRVFELEAEVEHLRKAVESRDVIGQGKGILMERFRITADEAFRMLVHASQQRNIKLVALATRLAETGEWIGPAPE
jgi:AmiR/NasT family two-component response regulator